MPILGVIASSTRQGQSTITGAMEPIASVVVPSGGLASVTFGSIPQTYTHLQLRVFGTTNRTSASRDTYWIRFNSDTGNNYSRHSLYGDGASVGADAATSISYMIGGTIGGNGYFGVNICDILEYANTNIYKTIRGLGGVNDNTANFGLVDLSSGSWRSTAAITSITLLTSGTTSTQFNQYSQFALYGIKGA